MMINNVGKTNIELIKTLGAITPGMTSSNINIIAGEIGLGFIMFDPSGTIGVITEFTNNASFVVKTYAISIDIETLLSQTY